MKKEDICTHYMDKPERYMGAVNPPIFQTSLFVDCERNPEDRFVYTRVSNPTTDIAEQKIAMLEGGEAARCFSSGMGAISAAMMHYLKKDCHVVAVASIYGPARRFLETYMVRFGVEATFVEGTDVVDIEAAIRENTTLIYLESPSTFLFLLQDLEVVANVAKKHGVATVVDNSWSTPIFQNPIKFGIDMVVHSASKYLGGHSDIVGGVVIGRKVDMDEIAQQERELFGAVMSPFDSWLLIRGLRTLPVRMKQHMENALKVAEFLDGRKEVKEVIYPFYKTHPQYELAQKQMTGGSGLMSVVFDLTSEQFTKMLEKIQLFQKGCSWGGYESLIAAVGANVEEDTPTMKKGLVRLHIGQEDADSLIEDLRQAIEYATK